MKRKLLLNSVSSLLMQVVTIVCGLILPQMILRNYGSAVNGVVQSVTQFLGVISFMELGMGQVIQSALYKPLLDGDMDGVSGIIASGGRFFRRVAYMLVAYVVVLILIYPLITTSDFDWFYTATLIGAISISTFAQYYFGVVDRLLLNADQRGYIQYFSQIATLIINTLACVIMINNGATIQKVKLTTSLIFLIRPLVIRLYVNRKYRIDRKKVYTGEPIKQKWNGIAQHVAAVVLENTDTIVLTLMSTLENVSIYSVYHLVVHGVRQIYFAAAVGIQSAVGNLWAKQDMDVMKAVFSGVETILHFSVVFLFSCTGILMLPFVQVYTNGITDVNYIQPVFSILIVLAYALQCLKTPYNIVVMAAGHYKQTQHCHIISAALNLVVTVAAVHRWGLVGVAVGTMVGMLYQMLSLAFYVARNLLHCSMLDVLGHIVVDLQTVLVIWIATSWVRLGAYNYVSWFVMAVQVAVIAAVVTVVMALLYYRKQFGAVKDVFANRNS